MLCVFDSQDMHDPFGDTRTIFQFKHLLKRLRNIQNRMDNNPEESESESDPEPDACTGSGENDGASAS